MSEADQYAKAKMKFTSPKSLELGEKAVRLPNADFSASLVIISALGYLGRANEAAKALEDALNMNDTRSWL